MSINADKSCGAGGVLAARRAMASANKPKSVLCSLRLSIISIRERLNNSVVAIKRAEKKIEDKRRAMKPSWRFCRRVACEKALLMRLARGGSSLQNRMGKSVAALTRSAVIWLSLWRLSWPRRGWRRQSRRGPVFRAKTVDDRSAMSTRAAWRLAQRHQWRCRDKHAWAQIGVFKCWYISHAHHFDNVMPF